MIDINGISAFFAVLIALGSLVLAWRKEPVEKKSSSADAGDKISDAALQLIEPMQKRIVELEQAREHDKNRISELERRVTDMECELRTERSEKEEIIAGAKRLYRQVESMEGRPVYRPPGIPGTGELKAK